MSYSDSTDTDRLLAAVADGDQAALSDLIQLYAPYLRRIIQLRISPELSARMDVSDILQETELAVLRRIDEFIAKRPASFRVWLRSRAIEQLADQHRRHVAAKKRSVRREQRLNDTSSLAIARSLLSETPSKALRRQELAEQIRNIIDSLNYIDREMLTLRHAEGLTNQEIAEALQIEPMTARKRYGRALRRLVEKANLAGLDADLWWGQMQ